MEKTAGRIGKFVVLIGLALGLVTTAAQAGIPSESEAGQIAMVVSKLLEEKHFTPRRLDNGMSKEFLKAYLNALDYNHIFFLQSDVDGFQKYTNELDDDLILADPKPEFAIYQVYSNRVEQACAAIKELLQEKYDFNADEAMVIDRHESPWAVNDKEWREALRQHVKYELLEERLNKEKPEEAIKTVGRRYDRMLRGLHENDIDTVEEVYLNALTSLYDPHTQYMAPASFENFTIDMRLSLFGIGAVLKSEDGYAKIASIVPDGPADRDKRLKPNDRIVGVAQGDGPMVDVVDMKLNKVVEQIRGPKGTIVRLKVIPADAADSSVRVEINIKRDEIKLKDQETKAKIIEKPSVNGILRIGYLDLPSFYVDPDRGADSKSCTHDVQKLLAKLMTEKVDGLILDLRRNSGGSLQEAISLTGLFIDEGPVVQVKDTQGHVNIGRDVDAGEAFDGPLIILVSRASASASEILAAALQDYGRAIIVGDTSTFGKGTVQQMISVAPMMPSKHKDPNASGALKLTIQKFYRVSGGSTQSRGVISDIELPSSFDAAKIGENYLPHYLPYDEVVPATYTHWSRRPPPVEELRRRSAERVKADPEFRYIEEDVARLKKKLAEKTVSLNEAKRLAEKKESENRNELRKKEREARHIPKPKVSEITLSSLSGQTNTETAVTRKVLEEAMESGKTNTASAGGTNVVKKAEAPAPDPDLNEGLSIMADYIELLGGVHARN